MGNFSWAEHQCLLDPTSCYHGFSVALWVNMTWQDFLNESTSTFISTAPEEGRSGFRLYQDGFYTKAVVHNDSVTWQVEAYRQLSWNNWTNLAIRWSQEEGLMLHVNGLEAAVDRVGNLSDVSFLNASDHLLLGCRLVQDDVSALSVDHASAMVDELAIWRWRLRDQERPFFVGGHVPRPKPLYRPPATTTEEPGTTAEPDYSTFDYQKDLIEVTIPGNPDANPFYTSAAQYWPLTKASLDPRDKLGVAAYTKGGRNDQGEYYFMASARAHVKLGSYGGSCAGDLSRCMDGLSTALWVQIPSRPPPQTAILLTSGGQQNGGVGYSIHQANSLLTVSVAYDGLLQEVALPEGTVKPARWTNLGFAWHPDHLVHPLAVFVDGEKLSVSPTVTNGGLSSVFSLCHQSAGEVWLGCEQVSEAVSYDSLSLDDIVVWDRYMNHFDGHHFLGTTYNERSHLTSADLYWSSDYFLHRDLKASGIRPFHPLYVTTGSDASWVAGRDGKGQALKLEPMPRGWAVIGESRQMQGSPLIGYFFGSNKCLTDPGMCTLGMSLSMWIKVYSAPITTPPQRQYLLSSGEHNENSVGVSVYLFEGKFGVAISDGIDYWKVILADPIELNSWIQVGFTWSKAQGLWIFMDGHLHTINKESIPFFRDTNVLNRVTLGRANDEKNFEATSEFAFEDIGIEYDYLIPAEYRKRFGLTENPYYASASVSWTRDLIGSSQLSLLSTAKGASGNFKITDQGIQLNYSPGTAQDAYIDLGKYNMCPHTACTLGMGLSLWFRSHKTSADHYIFRSSPTEDSNRVSISIEKRTVMVKLTHASNMWECQSTKNVQQSQWMNIGVTWGSISGLKLFIGGQSDSSSTASVSVASANVPASLTLGVNEADNVTGGMDVEVAHVTIWNKEVLQGHYGALIGASEYSLQLYSINDYYWPFEAPLSNLIANGREAQHISDYDSAAITTTPGPKMINDKIEHGTAWTSDQYFQTFINLGNFSGECIVDPGLCVNRLAVGVWLKLYKGQDGYIFSSGAQAEGSTGVSIRQYLSNNLGVTVADGTNLWSSQVSSRDVPYDAWLHLRLVWQINTGTKVYINNHLVMSLKSGSSSVRTSKHYEVLLGKSNSMSNEGYLTAAYDDVTIAYDKDDMMIMQAGCYDTAMIVYTLSLLEVPFGQLGLEVIGDRYGNTGSATRLLGTALDLGTILRSGSCPADPTQCDNGLSFSIWIKIPSWVQFKEERYVISYGYPSNTGFAIRIGEPTASDPPAAGASNATEDAAETVGDTVLDAVDLRLVCTVHRGDYEYEASVPLPPYDEWTNVAVAWSNLNVRGVSVFVNGNLTANEYLPLMSTTLLDPADSHLYLGGKSIGEEAIPGIELDDFAVWDIDLETVSGYGDKMQGNTCPPTIVDPTMFYDTEYYIPVVIDTCILRMNQTCVDSIKSLYEYFEAGNEFDEDTLPVALEILFNATRPKGSVLSEEMLFKASEGIMYLSAELRKVYTETLSLSKSSKELNWLVESVSNLLFPVMYQNSWLKIQQVHDSLITMIESMEKATLHLLQLTEYTNQEEPLQIDLHYSNMYIMAKKFVYLKNTRGFYFPVMNYDTMNDTVGMWYGELDRMALSGTVFKEVTNGTENTTVSLVVGIYDTLHYLLPTTLPEHMVMREDFPSQGRINSRVFTSSVSPRTPDGWFRTSKGLQFEYQKIQQENTETETEHCMFWDSNHGAGDRKGAWTDNGCFEVEDTKDKEITECVCNHMTMYAILIKPLPEPIPDPHEMPLKILTYIGLILSMVTLTVFAFKVFALKQEKRDIPIILKNLTAALIFLLLFVAIAESAGKSRPTLCQAMSILQHYLYSVVFCWLWMETIDLLYTITTAVMCGHNKYYISFAWGLPLVPVIGLSVVDLNAYGVLPHCWIAYTEGIYHYALFGPCFVFLFLALVVSLINICNIFSPALKDELIFSHVRTAIRNNLVLMPCLILAWLFGYFGLMHPDNVAVQYLSVIFYSFQGFIIVMAHSVGNPYFYVMRDKYEANKKDAEEEDEENVSRPGTVRPPTARPPTARPTTGRVAPVLIYRP